MLQPLIFFTVGLRCRHDMNQTNFWSCSHMVLNINFVTYVASNHSFFTFYRAMMCLEKAQSTWKLVPLITFFFTYRITISKNPHPPHPQIKSPQVETSNLNLGKGKEMEIKSSIMFLLACSYLNQESMGNNSFLIVPIFHCRVMRSMMVYFRDKVPTHKHKGRAILL